MNQYLRHLANFAHVVEAGSITGAANRHHVSPSVMSESVKIIENYYRESLLERRRSGVVTTSRGLEVYQYARIIVEAAQKALDTDQFDASAGSVKISMPVELASSWFHAVLKELAQELPDVHLTLMGEDEVLDHEKYARDLFFRVSRQRSDFAFNVLHEVAIRAVYVARPDLISGHTVDDLAFIQTLPLICSPRSSHEARFPIHKPVQKKQKELIFQKTLQVSDIQSRIQMARAGLGVTGCLEPTILADVEGGDLVVLAAEQLSIPLWLGIGSPHQRPAAVHKTVAERFANGVPITKEYKQSHL